MISIDRRENILARVFEILGTVDGIMTVSRNRDQLPADQRPAIVMLDGDEETRPDSEHRGRLAKAPVRIIAKPEIYIALESQKPKNETVGQELNAFRVAILKAVLNDVTLQGLVGGNGEIDYAGCMTDLARGRTMDGEMGLMLAITYAFKPTEL